jgi:large subunit ribosomal protein L15
MFEGGQTKLYKRLPKRGFTNVRHAEPMLPLNLGTLQTFIDMGRLDANKPLTMKDLVDAGITKASSVKHGIKLLAKGKERLKSPIKLEISRASESAIEALEEVGGEVTTVHYNRLALRALLKPEKFEVLPKQARPPPKLLPYYTSWKHRGYLSLQAQMRHLLKKNPDFPVEGAIATLTQNTSNKTKED